MWTSTRFILHLSLLFLLQLNMKGQADAAGHCTDSQGQATGCCERKTVGSYNYTFVEEAPGGPRDCLTGCRYNRDDDGTGPYCFASGPYKSTCTSRVEITNYCYRSNYCYGTITESNADIINYKADANSTVCETVKSTVTEVSATCFFPTPDGGNQPVPCTPYDHETGTPFSRNFNIGCKDGETDQCLVHAKN